MARKNSLLGARPVRAAALFLLLCTTTAAAPSARWESPTGAWELIADPESVGYSRRALGVVDNFVRGLPATAVMVVVDGRVLYRYGDLAEQSVVASVRKSILAMLYGKHVASGDIDLDASLAELGWNDHQGLLENELGASIRDLITARSGIYHPAANPGDSTADAPPRGSVAPGSYFLYNNWDFNTAGALFEELTGRNLYDAVLEDLALPLGMEDFDRDRHHKSGDLTVSRAPAYHMFLSTRDMARIGLLMLREGSWNGEQLVPAEWTRWIRSRITPRAETNPPWVRQGFWGYGAMWWVWDDPSVVEMRGAYSAAGAFGRYITVIPELDMVVALQTATAPRGNTSLPQYEQLLQRIVAARCSGTCD